MADLNQGRSIKPVQKPVKTAKRPKAKLTFRDGDDDQSDRDDQNLNKCHGLFVGSSDGNNNISA
jgi:hypothetical protein